MGAAAIVVESAASARARGVTPICEVLSAVTANSAFHGSRLDVDAHPRVMEDLIVASRAPMGRRPHEIVAEQGVFVSHETYTPARGGSAQAEVEALRFVFGRGRRPLRDRQHQGLHRPRDGCRCRGRPRRQVARDRHRSADRQRQGDRPRRWGALNLSKGGAYPVNYALRLGAGFGSQISMSLMRWVPTPTAATVNPTNSASTTASATPRRGSDGSPR